VPIFLEALALAFGLEVETPVVGLAATVEAVAFSSFQATLLALGSSRRVARLIRCHGEFGLWHPITSTIRDAC
jgi:hypothetical protein